MFTKTKLSYLTKCRVCWLATCFIPMIIIIIFLILGKNIHEYLYKEISYYILAFIGFIFLYSIIYINRNINDEIEHDKLIETNFTKHDEFYYL